MTTFDANAAIVRPHKPGKTRRLYYYTGKQWGLKSLWEKRLKVCRYSELNDPFELRSVDLRNKNTQAAWDAEIARATNGHFGLLCFSADWRSSPMWSQYADKHAGMCLGFDVVAADAIKIHYVAARGADPLAQARQPLGVDATVFDTAMRFKHDAWRHEQEWRLKVPLNKAVDGIHFRHFDDSLHLREVILGACCSLQPSEVVEAVVNPPLDVEIFQACAKAGRFDIGRNKLVETHTRQGFRAALALAQTVYADQLPDDA